MDGDDDNEGYEFVAPPCSSGGDDDDWSLDMVTDEPSNPEDVMDTDIEMPPGEDDEQSLISEIDEDEDEFDES